MDRSPEPAAGPSRWALAAAFGAIYLLWGSNYLALRFAVEEIPPFLMMAGRSLLAGGILYAWGRLRTGERPTRRHWRTAAVIGPLLFLFGHGSLAWAVERVPSGASAVAFATLPLWMVLIESVHRRRAPRGRVVGGLVAGVAGVAVLAGPGLTAAGSRFDPLGIGALLVATLGWAAGSMLTREMDRPASTVLATGTWLLAGGAALTVTAVAAGEMTRFDPAAITARGLLGFGYAVILGSLVAFGAYIWLLRVQPLPRVATYAFVNPIVAVGVGWAIGGETVGPRLLLATTLVVAGVAGVLRATPADPREGPLPAGRRAVEGGA